MTTIKKLLESSEVNLAVAEEAGSNDLFFDKYIELAKATSLLAIARSLNHIVDHGVSYGTLPMLKVDEEKTYMDRIIDEDLKE